MKLTYWVAPCLDDSPAYNIRAKTKRDCLAEREARGARSYGEPQKHVIEYDDAFDLMEQCLSERRGSEPMM
jgi:hypothetical protein